MMRARSSCHRDSDCAEIRANVSAVAMSGRQVASAASGGGGGGTRSPLTRQRRNQQIGQQYAAEEAEGEDRQQEVAVIGAVGQLWLEEDVDELACDDEEGDATLVLAQRVRVGDEEDGLSKPRQHDDE